MGRYCGQKCPQGRFGHNCTQECDCHQATGCNASTGDCECLAGFTGKKCDEQCQAGYFGENCSQVCNCNQLTTANCNHITGECSCISGWTGARCETQCPTMKWGQNCQRDCMCMNNNTCHHLTGKCICSRGWTGPDCSHKCPFGTFGQNCEEQCPFCAHGEGTCNHITGHCNCAPGYMGSRCEITCMNGTYGFYCRQTCKCTNGATCQPNNGVCRCLPGFMGPRCDEVCPVGFYGDHCMEVCNCAKNQHCDPERGCISEISLTGNYIDDFINPFFIAGVTFAVCLLIIFVICMAVKYKRKMEEIRTDISIVYRGAEERTSDSIDDVQNFNNPIYSSHPWMDDTTQNNMAHSIENSNFDYEKSNLRDIFPPNKDTDSETEQGTSCASGYSSLNSAQEFSYNGNIFDTERANKSVVKPQIGQQEEEVDSKSMN
ncbi:protein draper-like [Uloborus diversus]|uniref:protein draper-like n=1 Tax=Uloborus diversus TaxID=327109 RepID=UPI002408F268|nr:protein draper-like [Uloborus diversus]